VLTNFASFLAMLLAMQLIAIWLYQRLVPDSYRFLSIFQGDWWLYALLAANFVLMLNRIAQRMFFVTSYYGVVQGLMSLPRLLWGNLVNFLANWRAIAQALQAKDIRRMAWAKTDHDFPMLGEGPRLRQPLGQILIAQGALTESQLQEALLRPLPACAWACAGAQGPDQHRTAGRCSGPAGRRFLGVSGERLIPDEIAALLPAHLALHYSVVPLREEEDAGPGQRVGHRPGLARSPGAQAGQACALPHCPQRERSRSSCGVCMQGSRGSRPANCWPGPWSANAYPPNRRKSCGNSMCRGS
jgi:adsorption protein B